MEYHKNTPYLLIISKPFLFRFLIRTFTMTYLAFIDFRKTLLFLIQNLEV